MGFHKRAWEGMTILIFDETPLEPMKIEQTIAATMPNIEIQIDSFENYNDALNHCRDRRDVALFIISDKCRTISPKDLFDNLSQVYESATGWPAIGILYRDDVATLEGYQALASSSRLIQYVAKDELLDPRHLPLLLENIWQEYIDKLELEVFPEALQRTWLALASECGFSADSHSFQQKVTTLIVGNLNVSWLDMLALRWVHVFKAIGTRHPLILAVNQRLSKIVASADPIPGIQNGEAQELFAVLSSRENIGSRISTLIECLDKLRMDGNLLSELDALKKIVKPGSPAIARALTKQSESIIGFAKNTECENNQSNKILKFKGVG